MAKDSKKALTRKTPPAFPTGLRIGSPEGGDVCIMDFIDNAEDADPQIFYSIALTKDQAKALAKGLKDFAESENAK